MPHHAPQPTTTAAAQNFAKETIQSKNRECNAHLGVVEACNGRQRDCTDRFLAERLRLCGGQASAQPRHRFDAPLGRRLLFLLSN
jgi:hypothetical protein